MCISDDLWKLQVAQHAEQRRIEAAQVSWLFVCSASGVGYIALAVLVRCAIGVVVLAVLVWCASGVGVVC